MVRVIFYYDSKFTRAYFEAQHTLIADYESFGLFDVVPQEKRSLLFEGATLKDYDPDELSFGGRVINKEELRFTAGGKDRELTWIVQFVGPIKESWRTELEKKGVQLFGDIHPYAVFAYMHPSVAARLENEEIENERPIQWVGRYDKSLKISQDLDPDEACDVIVHYFPWANKPEQQKLKRGKNHQDQEALAQSEGVLFIEPYFEPIPLNSQSRTVLHTDVAHNLKITGLNEIVAVTDTGIYRPHEAFSAPGKIVSTIDVAGDSGLMGGDGDGHGTHVSGSVAGQAVPYTEYNKYDGQGFEAKLIAVKVFNNAGDWAAGSTEYTFWKNAYLAGARVNNNSWGSSGGGYYRSSDRNADRICSEMRDYVLAVAAGNAGPGRSTLGSPGASKDVITVGACITASPEAMASFSSRGPARDGRIKPDLIAPGSYVTSAATQSVSGYVSYQGTSMATPQVAGVVALLRQHFKEKSPSIPNPSSALIKALLINGADEMTGPGSDYLAEKKYPNNSQGWGRVDVSRSLPYANLGRQFTLWDIATAPITGGKWTQTVNLEANAKAIKFTLAWIDAPGTVGSSVNLVNNLNLRVTAPGGIVFLGNNFTGQAPGYSVPGGLFDGRNNVEGIYLIEGKSLPGTLPGGAYQIEVIVSNMSAVNCGFALVVGVDPAATAPVPEPIRIAVMGDYQSQIKILLEGEGYRVDSFAEDAYSSVNPTLYKAVVLNSVVDAAGFDTLVNSGAGLVFLGPYPANNSGVGILSKRTLNPIKVSALWGNGPVKFTVAAPHSIFGARSVGSVVTLVSGGDNDYQTFDPLSPGQNIGANAMSEGLPTMVGVNGKKILLGGLGATVYTNISHWTADGKEIFKAAVKFAAQ